MKNKYLISTEHLNSVLAQAIQIIYCRKKHFQDWHKIHVRTMCYRSEQL